ncbi:MAG: lipocalin-like domain-containing protein [Verrucomicrobiota bacterium]
MKTLFCGLFLFACSALAQEWQTALPNWSYEFPRDHHLHASFKTEWWYFTGNLRGPAGERFGFELTFFRQGIVPPAARQADRSRFVVDDLKFAHFTVTDVNGQKFRFDQKASRGAFGEAGFDRGNRLAWIDDWSLTMDARGEFHLQAAMTDAQLDLALTPTRAPVIHGENGLSRKASGEGHASQYYSVTRLATSGSLSLGQRKMSVQGETWFDHEWATNQLSEDQIGWNWLCVQFKDGADLMLYQMRRRDGSADPASSGTLISPDGKKTHLTASAFAMTPQRRWRSAKTGADYPVVWRVDIPAAGLHFDVKPLLDNQELALSPLTYWEGSVETNGENASGVGYLELTGYAGALSALAR